MELNHFKRKKLMESWVVPPPNDNNDDAGGEIKKHAVIIVCSTTGNGDAPENASRFVRYLKKPIPSTLLTSSSPDSNNKSKPLQHLTYSVLALGDTNYDQFCESGKLIDKKLFEWGAVRAMRIMCADEATGLEEVVEPWMDCVLTKLENACKSDYGDGGKNIDDVVVENEGVKNEKNEGMNGKEETKIIQEEKTEKEKKTEDISQQSTTKPSSSTNNTPPSPPTKSPTPLYILYGSATGNAEHIAKDLTSTYESYLKNPSFLGYFTSVTCCDLNSYKKKCLDTWITPPNESNPTIKHGIIIICSTTGNADAPENADRFIRWMKRKSTTPSNSFDKCAYAVLGLGDSNYDVFCAMGKVIDKRIHELGGTRALKVACADEATGLEDVVEPWVGCVIGKLAEVCKGLGDDVQQQQHEQQHGQPQMQSTVTTTSRVSAPTSKRLLKETSPSSMEEKKMDVEETPMVATAGTSHDTTTTPTSSARGVATIRKLLSLSPDKPLPTSITSTLPKMVTSLSSCELIHDHHNDGSNEQRIRGDSIADNMTVSSGSSGFLYTAAKPYESQILDARYLTNTNVECAQRVTTDILGKEDEWNDDEKLIKAMKLYEESFPLMSTTTKSGSEPTSSTTLQHDKNGKRVIEMTLSLPDDFTLEYEPGDSVGLIVPNTPQSTNFILNMLERNHGILPSQKVSVDAGHPITVEEAIKCGIDLSSPMKKKRLFLLSMYATDPEEENALRLLCGSDATGVELYQKYVEDQCRTVVDILQDFPSCQSIKLEGLLGCLPAIPPRYYSVCSSPLYDRQKEKNDGGTTSLKVAFSVVDYMTSTIPEDENSPRRMGGLATRRLECVSSPFLCGSSRELVSSGPNKPTVQIFPKPTHEFRLPPNMSTPLILIGPGTGIAPFIGFLSHRQAQLASLESTEAADLTSEGTWRGGMDIDPNDLALSKGDARGLNLAVDYMSKHQQVGEIDLFFGCRYSDHDYLYKDELEKFQNEGILTNLYAAFSRDGKEKTYVQTLMQKDVKCGRRLVEMIMEKDASVYICGDGNAMGKEVQDAIVMLLAKDLAEKGKCKNIEEGRAEAAAHVDQMKTFGRFVLDIWS